MKKKTFLFANILLVIGFFLSSCTSRGTEENGVSTLPTQQASGNPAVTAPSNTLTMADTPTPTQISKSPAIPTAYQLPAWMKTENNFLMIVTGVTEAANQISFVNANTAERFSIRVPSDQIRGYFWFPDGKHFGFLSSDNRTAYLVDSSSGIVNKLSVGDRATILLNPTRLNKHLLERLEVYGSILDNSTLFFGCRLCYSPDLTYTLVEEFPHGQNAESQMSVENIFTQEKYALTSANDTLYDLETAWSPSKPEVAILQGIPPFNPDFGPSRLRGDRITIYDASTQHVINRYLGNFTSIRWKWSPDGRSILYTNLSWSSDLVGTKPCLLYVDTGQTKCINELENTELAFFSDYEWSTGGVNIYYIKNIRNPHRSDLCVYSLLNGSSHCPTVGIPELDAQNLEGFVSSPEGEFFLIAIGDSCSTCDYWGESTIAIVRADGKSVIPIGDQVLEMLGGEAVLFPATHNALWRRAFTP